MDAYKCTQINFYSIKFLQIFTNKFLFNAEKAEMVIFQSKQKKFEGDLKIKLCGKRLCPTESVKYQGVKIDTILSWQYHV